MKKILLLSLISTSLLFAVSSAAEKAYERGKIIASQQAKDVHDTVRVKKCKYYVVVDKNISTKMRINGYRGCEDEIYGASK